MDSSLVNSVHLHDAVTDRETVDQLTVSLLLLW